ncbi:MgtC/SapB family protein [bacterium]|nr:MgtC/SapB family protein [bacterium]
MSDLLLPLLKLGAALVLSAAVGLERLLSEKPAGMRTHILVGFGSALFMIVADLGGLDAGRVAAGLITGIGFLGAGTIIQERGTVHGLTTAASIWAVAGIGIAVSRGLWLLSLFATLGIIAVLWGLHFIEDVIERSKKKSRISKNTK